MFVLVVTLLVTVGASLASSSAVSELVYGRTMLSPAQGVATSCYGDGTRGQGCMVTYSSLQGESYGLRVDSRAYEVGDLVALRIDPREPSVAYRADTEAVVTAIALSVVGLGLRGAMAYQVVHLASAEGRRIASRP